MINELYGLSKALNDKNIEAYEWYREYKPLPKVTLKSPCIRIWLDDNGYVCDFEKLTSEQASVIRKYGSNQNSFPAFNISALYRITDPEIINRIESVEKGNISPDMNEIQTWMTENNWIKGAVGQVQKSLTDCPAKLMNYVESSASGSIIEKLALLYRGNDNAWSIFRDSLIKCIFEKLQNGVDSSLCMALLFHKGSSEKEHSNDTGNKLSIVLDIQNWREYGYPIACEHTTRQLNDMLLESLSSVQNDTCEDTDAFNSPFVNPGEPMPTVKLSGFEVTLRSMFNGQPCQYRYSKIDDGSYPISNENRSAVKKSLEWICNPDNEHITWEKIDKNEIAFVYPSKLPDVSIRFVSVFGKNRSENGIKNKMRFEEISKEFIKVFQGLPTKQKPENMQIFIIRKMDKARSKVVFTYNSTPEQLTAATDEWIYGYDNLPKLNIGELTTPFPLDVADIINIVWKQDGDRADGKTPVKRMKYYQGIELLLNTLPQRSLHNFIHILNENSRGLFCYVGNRIHRKDRISDVHMTSIGQALFVTGLLLYKCNIRKENYMEDFAFNFGQLLQISDELHMLYCKVKRSGDIPPQLVGNSLFVSAVEIPYQAFAQLSVRTNPYISWAKQFQHSKEKSKKEEVECSAKLLALYHMIADKIITKMDKSIRFGDFEKSQLFVGYLASLPKIDKDKKMKSDHDNITGGIENENGD